MRRMEEKIFDCARTFFSINYEINIFNVRVVLHKFAQSNCLKFTYLNYSISFTEMSNHHKKFANSTPYSNPGNRRFSNQRNNVNQNRNDSWSEIFNGSSQNAGTSSSADSRQFLHTANQSETSNVTSNPFNMASKSSVDEQNQKRLTQLSMMPYLERRGLKGLLLGNPRFHLMEFKGIPTFIKTSEFLRDLIVGMPDIRAKSIISIHTTKCSSQEGFVDYKLGFNSVKIITRLKDILGTGMIQLYKNSVQLVFPDLTETKLCEFNRVVGSEYFLPMDKSPYKLTHETASLVDVVLMLEKVCMEKIWGVNSVCCNGENSFISLSDHNLLFCLNRFAIDYKFKIEPSDTATFAGTIPSELIPIEDTNPNAPTNGTQTAKLSSDDILKFDGFKSLFDKHVADAKNSQLMLIKRSLQDSQVAMSTALNAFENSIRHDLTSLNNSISIQRAQIDLLTNQFGSIDNKTDIINNNITRTYDLLARYVAKRDEKKKVDKLNKRLTQESGNSVNPSTNGKTDLDDGILDDTE